MSTSKSKEVIDPNYEYSKIGSRFLYTINAQGTGLNFPAAVVRAQSNIIFAIYGITFDKSLTIIDQIDMYIGASNAGLLLPTLTAGSYTIAIPKYYINGGIVSASMAASFVGELTPAQLATNPYGVKPFFSFQGDGITRGIIFDNPLLLVSTTLNNLVDIVMVRPTNSGQRFRAVFDCAVFNMINQPAA